MGEPPESTGARVAHDTVRHAPALPPSVLGSPSALARLEANPPWWTPGPWHILRNLGWRFILLVPGVLFLIGAVALCFGHPWMISTVMIFGGKAMFLAVGLAISGITFAIAKATQSRRDPFCIHCGYSTQGLESEGICPECGRPYSHAMCAEYCKNPRWFRQRWRLAGAAPIGVSIESPAHTRTASESPAPAPPP